MSDVDLNEINPIPLTAVVSSGSGGYTVSIQYNVPPPVTVGEISDSFRVLPSTLTVNVVSSTVPSGYHLAASGDGTWTSVSSSSLSGAFTVPDQDRSTYDFTILVVSGTQVLASVDPRIIVKKLGSV